MAEDLTGRSVFLHVLLDRYASREDTILEIGCGDYRNVNYLKGRGYSNVEGIDKLHGTSIEEAEPKEYDIIFTMSTLFLIPKESEWVFKKIEGMARKYIITIEGETTVPNGVIGRDYSTIFKNQIEHIHPVFNEYGHARVFKK